MLPDQSEALRLPLQLSRSPPDTYDSFPPLRDARGNRTWGSGLLLSHRPDGEKEPRLSGRRTYETSVVVSVNASGDS